MAKMEFRFDPDLDFQKAAIDSVADIFRGQETCRTNFTVAPITVEEQAKFSSMEGDLGVGNRLRLLPEDILENVREIQLRNGLAPSEDLDGMNFTVEMETGTGKTYVYLRTIFELNRAYGFTKFVVVVPSVAIKEGVYKSLQITESHLRGLYDNTPYDYFIYDSQSLGQVRNFATSEAIQIMVINIDAFRRSFTDPEQEHKANIIHRAHDRMAGNKPIEFIQATNPIVIIDEPQSVDTTDKSREAIAALSPLCTLRYSATHVDRYDMVYRLDSIDAYQRKLVKQIEVAGIEVKDSHNKAYVKLLNVDNRKGRIRARIELDVLKSGNAKRVKKTVRAGDDLLELSGGRSVYDGYIIEDIYCEEGKEYVSFTSKPEIVRLNEVVGGVDEDEYRRLQIRKTIEEHLDKELRLAPKGIKVLSLFFIDRVANYRDYDDDGVPQPGKFVRIFEDEYRRAIARPKYDTLFEGIDRETAADGVHGGYFAVDKRSKDANEDARFKESRGQGKTLADEDAYQLIMRDKERLLSFESRLKFIFSHSALREGWDNPNVFQICTLNETASTLKKRQEIGRGLRICVNQEGERVPGFEVNTLTVMANESYEDFARKLQREIEEDEGIKFGIVEPHVFANIAVVDESGEARPLGVEVSERIWHHLRDAEYINAKGRVQDQLRVDLAEGELDLPEDVREHSDAIEARLRKVAGRLNLRNADDRKRAQLNKQVYLSPEFQELWDRIKYRTTFHVDFDPDALVRRCAERIKIQLVVGKPRFITRKATIDVTRGGVEAGEVQERTAVYDARDYELPDIVTYLQNETNLTRRSIVRILVESGRLADFKNNPQKFIEQVSAIIRDQMRLFIVDGIKYQRLGDEDFYAQELFEDNELFGYLRKNMLEAEKSVYDHVIYDADVEARLARSFETSDDVKVYAKLPGWFKIDTPLGGYNPDWAVLVEVDGRPRLYFVVESKGSLFEEDLRAKEQAKIDCGRAHFQALQTEATFCVANDFAAFADQYHS